MLHSYDEYEHWTHITFEVEVTKINVDQYDIDDESTTHCQNISNILRLRIIYDSDQYMDLFLHWR